jgi:signal transduction histidine kinase
MEREKIASEIHDKLQGDLIAIKNFNFIIKQLKDDHDKLSLYEDLDTTIDSAILNTKAVSHKLMPPMLGKIDFISLLEYYFKTFSLTNGKSFRLTYTNSNFTLPQDKVYESFRIVQLYCDYIQETVSEFNLGYHQDEIAYYIVFTDDAASFSISDCFTSESNYELLSIPVRLTILNAEIMQIDVKVGNHFILKINK